MRIFESNYYIEAKVPYNNPTRINPEYIEASFNFAWDMCFGRRGQHRAYRSGGLHTRTPKEIFANTFQGKLSEFAIYQEFHNHNLNLACPDLTTMQLGEWDKYDFVYNGYSLSVKSTKHFGNLLLLEYNDWDNNGMYIPNLTTGQNCIYDYFILVRIAGDITTILDRENVNYANVANYNDYDYLNLKQRLLYTVLNSIWSFDIPGYLSFDKFIADIRSSNNIIPQNAMLNGRIRMDATNYYYEAGCLDNINGLYNRLIQPKPFIYGNF